MCSAQLQSLVEQDPRHVFAGVLTPDGQMHCASVPLPAPMDLATTAEFGLLREEDRRRALVLPKARVMELPAVSVNHPVFREGELAAFITIPMPISLLSTIAKTTDDATDFRLGLLDHSGKVFVEDSSQTKDGDRGPPHWSA